MLPGCGIVARPAEGNLEEIAIEQVDAAAVVCCEGIGAQRLKLYWSA